MRIDEFSIFGMILHTGSYTAPHRLIRSRINPVMCRTGRCEIHISAVFGMLGRKNMIVQSTFVEVHIASLGMHPEQALGQFQHIIGIA